MSSASSVARLVDCTKSNTNAQLRVSPNNKGHVSRENAFLQERFGATLVLVPNYVAF